jgi:hypothetical protein
MNHFTNAQLSRIYKVSHVTIGNWIKMAIDKKNDLEIVNLNGKNVIIDNSKNRKEMSLLAERGSKFRNSLNYKKTKVLDEFYKIFSVSDSVEIFTELLSNKLIPLKFTYFDKGADWWCKFSHEDLNNKNYSYYKEEVSLIENSKNILIDKLSEYEIVNIIDIGPGDGYLSSNIIKNLINSGHKINYHAIDISKRMLDILEINYKNMFPEINCKYEVGDFDYIIMRDLLFFNKVNIQQNSCNLILFLGYTIGSVYDRHRVLKNFYDSMNKDDFLYINSQLRFEGEWDFMELEEYIRDEDSMRRYLWIPKLLGIDKEDYSLTTGFSEKLNSWVIEIELNKNIDIYFNFDGKNEFVSLKKDERVIVWNFYTYPYDELISEMRNVGFAPTQVSLNKENTQFLTFCEPKKVLDLK